MAAECGVSAVIVVGVEPVWQGGAALGFGGVGLGVGPFVREGAVEPFDLAVGLGPVGPGALVGDGQLDAGSGPRLRAVARAIEFLSGVKQFGGLWS